MSNPEKEYEKNFKLLIRDLKQMGLQSDVTLDTMISHSKAFFSTFAKTLKSAPLEERPALSDAIAKMHKEYKEEYAKAVERIKGASELASDEFDLFVSDERRSDRLIAAREEIQQMIKAAVPEKKRRSPQKVGKTGKEKRVVRKQWLKG